MLRIPFASATFGVASLVLACSPSEGSAPSTPQRGTGGAVGASAGGATASGTAGSNENVGGTDLVIPSSGGAPTGPPSLADGGIDALRNASCASNTARTEAAPSILQFVVDTSGSMKDNAPGTNRSKWEVTREALRTALDAIPPSTGVGILYFPEMRGSRSTPNGNETDPARPLNACVDLKNQVPIDLMGPAGSPHRTAVSTSLDAPGRPQGGTPTHDAYKVGVDAISKTTLPGNRFVVLITDGQPTYAEGCRGTGQIQDANDPRPIIDSATSAAASQIRTFVIGSPGSEQVGVPVFADARTWLSMMATAGGTATAGCSDTGPNFCHFDMTQRTDFAQALNDTLKLIVGTVVGCEYKIPTPTSGTIARDKVNVIYTPASGKAEIVVQIPAGDCTEGWRYSADGTKVELCPATCDRVQHDTNPQLDVIFGCDTKQQIAR